MKLNIIQIGNSLGLRLPKAIIEQCGFKDFVEVEIKDGMLIILPYHNPREGWEESFMAMAKAGDDKLIDPELYDIEPDEDDWTW